MDELEPLQRTGSQSYRMGLTLVDSLDTMHLMNLDAEFDEAVAWVRDSLVFGHQEDINVFETTIRVLGGLLSAYELSGAQPLLAAAEQLGLRLLFAFDTPTGLPYGTVGLRSKRKYNPAWAKGASTIAEVATLQLEFRALSRHTGKRAFERAAQRVMRHLRQMKWPQSLPRGLYPTFISPTSGDFTSDQLTMGARADSLYEYLLKQWLLSGKTDGLMRAMYDDSVDAIATHLVRHGGAATCANCTFIGQWNYRTGRYQERMDHLVCFVPGMLALGRRGDSSAAHMQLAEQMMHTCYRMYSEQPSGLAPEIAAFSDRSPRVLAAAGSKHNLLRPEAVESLFVLWRETGDERYREWGWRIFEAIERHCKVASGGYSGLTDVTKVAPPGAPQSFQSGKMESFFTAETLKYLFLLFGDGSQVPLDKFVFNTEAHPLRIDESYEYGNEYGGLPEPEELEEELRRLEQEGRADLARRVRKRSTFCSAHKERCT